MIAIKLVIYRSEICNEHILSEITLLSNESGFVGAENLCSG